MLYLVFLYSDCRGAFVIGLSGICFPFFLLTVWCDIPYCRYEKRTGFQVRRKFPQFEVDNSHSAIYEPMAGFVDAAMANSVLVQLARAYGATICENCTVQKIERNPNGKFNAR